MVVEDVTASATLRAALIEDERLSRRAVTQPPAADPDQLELLPEQIDIEDVLADDFEALL